MKQIRDDDFPLSATQELWVSGDMGDQAGFFGSHFVLAVAVRVRGRVDPARLQTSLDALVVRHEILRTTIVRGPDDHRQRVGPPAAVPLEVRDEPVPAGPRRDARAEQLLAAAELSPVDPDVVPVLRACLTRFAADSSVLTLTAHHTAVDEWSMQILLRDLAAIHAGRDAEPADVVQYREFAIDQQARTASPAVTRARTYWRRVLSDARIFAAPTERPVPESHTRDCRAHRFAIGAATLDAARELAGRTGAPVQVVLLAAFTVLAQQISGRTDQAIDTLVAARDDHRFGGVVGPVMNFLVLRTEIGGLHSFRDVVTAARKSWFEAHANEIPIQDVEREAPDVMEPNEETRRTNCIVGFLEQPFPESDLVLAGDSQQVTDTGPSTRTGPWIPHGVAWTLILESSGRLAGRIQFNPEDLDDRTVEEWAAGYQRIVAAGVADPDQEWRGV